MNVEHRTSNIEFRIKNEIHIHHKPATFAVPPFRVGYPKADRVLVVKSEKKLYLEHNGKVIRSYPVALGGNPKGHKQRQGDQRTPEGRYILDLKNPNSAYYKSIRISYPIPTTGRVPGVRACTRAGGS